MREIKFKGYALDNEYGKHEDCIVYENVYILQEGVMCDGDLFEVNGKDFFVCQYTGLKDKNAKEIYEGDIIKSKYYSGKPFLIEWKNLENCGCCSDDSGPGFNFKGIEDDEKAKIEVIGNIYENPELLNA
jgi:uncharacterized phage protein (TIGR01671 family)